MEVTKRDNLASDINVHELGQAMAELDLASVPPEKRAMAVMDHLVHIMIGTVQDATERDKLATAWAKRVLGLG